ncbi:putative cytosolic protein [Geobacillus sp. WSUCF1]|nr:putative cytosolic protein [Geobacillus sp. WSUCF1]
MERKKGFITYLKEAEKIAEFLNIIGAHQALLRFEDIRIVRDMRNSVNRLVNCETANLNKTIGAALRQVENIRYIDETIGLDSLPAKLREIAKLRIEHQDVTLKELGRWLPVEKSANPASTTGCAKLMRSRSGCGLESRSISINRCKGEMENGGKTSGSEIKNRAAGAPGGVVRPRSEPFFR